MTESSNRIVLYRAPRDGFTAKELKNVKCDGIEYTVTIIKTDRYYVFGCYASS